jgi:hypothetical protein
LRRYRSNVRNFDPLSIPAKSVIFTGLTARNYRARFDLRDRRR